MPVGVEKVQEVEKTLIESNGEICDLYLKSAIEAVIIKWAAQINDVLANNSSENTFDPNPTPSAGKFFNKYKTNRNLIFLEIHFWNLRLKNLQFIYEQLRDCRVHSMAIILEKTDSAYYNCFRNLFKSVVISLAEAKDINLYLKPLKKHIDSLEEIDFSDCIPLLAPMMHVICLIWSNSQYYDQVKITILLKQICNLLICQVRSAVLALFANLFIFFRQKNS